MIPALLLALLVAVLTAIGWCVLVRNALVALRHHVAESASQVDVELARRRDLIPNLARTVAGWAEHERATLLAAARDAAQETGSAAWRAESALGSALGALVARVEAYPEVAASRGYANLAGELAHTEDRIASALRFYNANVRAYEVRRRSFPINVIAKGLGLGPVPHFDAAVASGIRRARLAVA